jgi:hypothetical protein
VVTPYKKPADGTRLSWQKEFNTVINEVRAVIERVLSHLKNWRVLHTDYRRPLDSFPTTISAVAGPHFWLTG